MKQDKLYTVNRWNRPAFVSEENVFSDGGLAFDNLYDKWASKYYGASYGDPGKTLNDYKKGLGTITSGIATGVGSAANKAISGQYSTNSGKTFSNVMSGIGGAVSLANPLIGAGITLLGQAGGGLINYFEGKQQAETQKKIDEFNKEAKKQDLAFNSIGFGEDYNAGINDLAFNSYNSAAFGGPLDMITNNNDMGAIEYNFMSDWLANKNKKAEQKDNGLTNMFAGVPASVFADGGYVLEPFFNARTWKTPVPETLTPIDYPSKGGTYGGGKFGGSGTSTKIDYPDTEYEEIRDTLWIPLTQDFNTAFKNARKNKQKEFTFNGKKYSTELGDNPDNYKAGQRRTETILVPWETKRKQAKRNEKAEGGPLNILYNQTPAMFALGGDVQSHGADFSTGLSHINAGGTHEMNPYDGVQYGTDNQGVPNLLEEGEVVFNDYVYSNRIELDEQAKARFHFPKKKDITYADAAKKLEKEAKERPNDPISKAALKAQLSDLADEQERQKKEMEAERAREQFESLSPDEQVAVMQNLEDAAQQQAIAEQQQMAQEQAMMAQQPTEQPIQYSPEEAAIMEQQQMSQEPVMSACGGKINRFDDGGELKKKIYEMLGLYTDNDFTEWLKNKGLPAWNAAELDKDPRKWEGMLTMPNFLEVLAKDNPALADAISRGYRLGITKELPTNSLTFDFQHGGWGSEDYNAWNGSTDAAWIEAVEKGLVKEGMNSQQIGDALMQTDAYKRGTEWLSTSEDNRLNYLQQILASKDAPEAAKKYAAKFIDENGWKEGAARDYNTIFDKVRSTHPGTYWKTPTEILRGQNTQNLVYNEGTGKWEPLVGALKGLTLANTYQIQGLNSDDTYNYYRRPAPAVAQAPAEKAADDTSKAVEEEEYKPNYKKETNYSLWSPLIEAGLMAAGVGKPDFTELDNIMNRVDSQAYLADWKPIGTYVPYKPFDVWSQRNRNAANLASTIRAINNTVNPNKQASTIAALNTALNADGQLGIQAEQTNYNNLLQSAGFNKDTEKYNSTAFGQNSQFNTNALNQYNQFRGNLATNVALNKLQNKADYEGNWYQIASNFSDRLAQWEKWKRDYNTATDTLFSRGAGMSEETPVTRGRIKKIPVTKGTSNANGGKVKRRKRGLTI